MYHNCGERLRTLVESFRAGSFQVADVFATLVTARRSPNLHPGRQASAVCCAFGIAAVSFSGSTRVKPPISRKWTCLSVHFFQCHSSPPFILRCLAVTLHVQITIVFYHHPSVTSCIERNKSQSKQAVISLSTGMISQFLVTVAAKTSVHPEGIVFFGPTSDQSGSIDFATGETGRLF